jgi:hypothetical protein
MVLHLVIVSVSSWLRLVMHAKAIGGGNCRIFTGHIATNS